MLRESNGIGLITKYSTTESGRGKHRYQLGADIELGTEKEEGHGITKLKKKEMKRMSLKIRTPTKQLSYIFRRRKRFSTSEIVRR